MKKSVLCLLTVFAFAMSVQAQKAILFVNDNDNIVYNTDTVLIGLNNSIYASNYDYWSVPDSGGAVPSGAYMNNYELVIWYTSTDGVGLAFWSGTTAANNEVVSYAITGKPMWVIGQDLLYNMYGGSGTFASGEFAYDFMGLASYDNQSYVNDGNVGVPQMERMPAAPVYFPATIKWIFSTLWYADGCTPLSGTMGFYKMGPTSYALSGSVSMFHNMNGGNNMMSTFFDPALIDTRANRVNFLEKGITYLLSTTIGVKETVAAQGASVFPNPATGVVYIRNAAHAQDAPYYIADLTGREVMRGALSGKRTAVSVSNLSPGVYIITIGRETKQSLKLVKE